MCWTNDVNRILAKSSAFIAMTGAMAQVTSRYPSQIRTMDPIGQFMEQEHQQLGEVAAAASARKI